MTTIYLIRRFLKDLDGSASEFVGLYKTAYKSKEKAGLRRDMLNEKSHNYVYSIVAMELV